MGCGGGGGVTFSPHVVSSGDKREIDGGLSLRGSYIVLMFSNGRFCFSFWFSSTGVNNYTEYFLIAFFYIPSSVQFSSYLAESSSYPATCSNTFVCCLSVGRFMLVLCLFVSHDGEEPVTEIAQRAPNSFLSTFFTLFHVEVWIHTAQK